jgi:hypothetical protein
LAACDGGRAQGELRGSFAQRVDALTLGSAILIAPAGSGVAFRPTYRWNSVPFATSYDLWVSDSTGVRINRTYFASETGCGAGGECSIAPLTDLQPGPARWWIRAHSALPDTSAGPWSRPLDFTVSTAATEPPGRPTLIAPGGSITTGAPAYQWTAVTGAKAATHYLLWVNDALGVRVKQTYSASDAGCVSGGTCRVNPVISSPSPFTLNAGIGRFWVQAINALGTSDWGPGKSFSVVLPTGAPPATPTLIAPLDVSTQQPEYRWNASPGATLYHLWVTDSTGVRIQSQLQAGEVGCATTAYCSLTPAVALASGAAKFWVRASNAFGASPWSAARSFLVQTSGNGGTTCNLATSWTGGDDVLPHPGSASMYRALAASRDPVHADERRIYAVGTGWNGETWAPGGVVRVAAATNAVEQSSFVNWTTGFPNDVATTTSGDVYVIARLDDTRVLRKSTDGGSTWTDVQTLPMAGAASATCDGGFVASEGDMVVMGGSCDGSGWTLRRSNDAGATWQPAFTFSLAAGRPARLSDVALFGGEAYGIGYAEDGTGARHWVVVRGTGTGTVSDQFTLAAGQAAGGVGFGGTSALFAAGYALSGQSSIGVVRRRSATGQWDTIDSFGSRAVDLVQVGNQLISVGSVGSGVNETVTTRRSDDGGATWRTFEEGYKYPNGRGAAPVALTADPLGNVYGAFNVQDVNGDQHVIVRKLACQ